MDQIDIYSIFSFNNSYLFLFIIILFLSNIRIINTIIICFAFIPFVIEIETLQNLLSYYPSYYEGYEFYIIYRRIYIHYFLLILLFMVNYFSVYFCCWLCYKLSIKLCNIVIGKLKI